MKTLFILDADFRSALSENLRARVTEIARAKRHDVGVIELGRGDAPPCTGCLRCLVRPAESCISRGFIARLIREAPEYQVIIFLAPVVFGTCSSTIKNVVDRGGLVIAHHTRCRQIIIGYAEDATDEERSTFIDITAKHRGKADVVHPRLVEDVQAYFTRSLEDNESLCDSPGAVV
jgi:multimeric flavodoxin WrbA